MPAVQTSYAAQHPRWVEGMIPSMVKQNVITRVAEDAEGIGFGKVAVAGSADGLAVDSEATAAFLGIAVLDTTKNNKYEKGDNVAILNFGEIVVQASVAVAVGDPVYYVPATGVLTNVATGNTQIAGAEWATSTSAAGLAIVRLK